MAGAGLALSPETVADLEEAFPVGVASGERYPDWAQEWLDHGSPAAWSR